MYYFCKWEFYAIKIFVQEIHILVLVKDCVDLIITILEVILGILEKASIYLARIYYPILFKIKYYKCKLLYKKDPYALKGCCVKSYITFKEKFIFYHSQGPSFIHVINRVCLLEFIHYQGSQINLIFWCTKYFLNLSYSILYKILALIVEDLRHWFDDACIE